MFSLLLRFLLLLPALLHSTPCVYCEIPVLFNFCFVIANFAFSFLDTHTAVLLVRRRRDTASLGGSQEKFLLRYPSHPWSCFHLFCNGVGLGWLQIDFLLFLRVWAGNWSGTSRIGQECACPSGPHGQKLYLIPFFVITISLAQIELPDSHSSTFVSLYLFITMSRHPPIRACFLRLYLSRGQAPVVTTWQA